MQSKAILFSGIALQAQRFANLVHEVMSLWYIHLLVSVGFFFAQITSVHVKSGGDRQLYMQGSPGKFTCL